VVPRLPVPIGAHVSAAGGLRRALPRADAIGAETMQVFVANPRSWAAPKHDADDDEAFRSAAADNGLPVFVHAPYLINLGSPVPETVSKSVDSLLVSLRRGTAIGARGVVVHAGSAGKGNPRDAALGQVREQLLRTLDAVPKTAPLLIEPTAGGGGALACNADSLAAYLDVVGPDERVGVCLDTCHMHAAGHDLSTTDGFAAALRAFGRATGHGRVGLVHVNDSRDAAGSRRDRHEALGRGQIGRKPFAALFTSTVTRGVPLIVETAEADHAGDIVTLKALRGAPERGR
jgi:deoxyribonuclease-4